MWKFRKETWTKVSYTSSNIFICSSAWERDVSSKPAAIHRIEFACEGVYIFTKLHFTKLQTQPDYY